MTQSETAADDDNELVRRARTGDADRFATLVRRHQDRVYRLAWRMVGPDAAEDVAQQTFLKAWLGLDQFTGASSFGTWLYRLAMNCCLDHLRHTHRFHARPLADADACLASDMDVAEVTVEALEESERSAARSSVARSSEVSSSGDLSSRSPPHQSWLVSSTLFNPSRS